MEPKTMNLIETLRIAWSSLLVNKLRALLTMLGIIIGVAAVIALLALGGGVQSLVSTQLQNLGSNLIFVFPGTNDPEHNRLLPPQLTNEDLAAASDPSNAPAILAVSAEFANNAVVTFGGASHQASVLGVPANYSMVRTLTLSFGDFFDQSAVDARSRVAVLGANAYTTLFGDDDPFGQHVLINGVSFEVIGVMEARGGLFGARNDDRVIIPITTAQSRLFPPPLGTVRRVDATTLVVKAVDERSIPLAIEQITELLRQRHDLTDQGNDFMIVTQEDLLDTFSTITSALTAFLGAIAAISLLVGGIGIMNIMLVSVTERTREIGLRKAVGARRSDIGWQFLVEALTLSLIGGICGIALGGALAAVGTIFLRQVNQQAHAQVQLSAIALAVSVSLLVGIVFGSYPAMRAARLNPIDALRSD
jgi:putative ABC transport system permease protein